MLAKLITCSFYTDCWHQGWKGLFSLGLRWTLAPECPSHEWF